MGHSMEDAELKTINFLWFAQKQSCEVFILLTLSSFKKAMPMKSLKLMLECHDTDVHMEWGLFT